MNDCGVREESLVFLHFSTHFREFWYNLEKVLSYGDDRNVAKCMTLWKCRDRMTPKRRISKKVLSYGDGKMVWMLPCPASLAIPLRQPPVGGTLRMRACGVRFVLIQCLIYRKVLLEFEKACIVFLCTAFRIEGWLFWIPERNLAKCGEVHGFVKVPRQDVTTIFWQNRENAGILVRLIFQSQSVEGWLGCARKFVVFLHFSKHFRAFWYKWEKCCRRVMTEMW